MEVCSRHPLQQAPPAVNTNMTTADIVAIGSGHNGLVAAAYLAVAGRKVLVLERNAWFGGGVVSRELTLPGFRHDQHSMSHIFIQANPLLKNDELGLKSRYGLEYIFPEVPMMSVFEDGSTLKLYRDRERSAAEIAKFSKRDAEAFRRVSLEAAAWLPMIAASLYAPPAPVGATHAMLDQSREGRELWRVMQMSSHDLLCEQFEHEQVRTHFARVAGENLVSPDEKATAIGVYVFLGFLEGCGFGVARGGAGRLTDALIACIRNHGGEVIANADVARIKVANGRATGVETVDGRSFDETKQEYGDHMLAHLSKFVTNIPGCVLQAHIDSPVDMERTSPSFRRGDLHGIATAAYQSGAHRPTPELGQYTVPGVDRFYLVGPFQHPGGGVFGAGRATAMKMFEALGMDFEKQTQGRH